MAENENTKETNDKDTAASRPVAGYSVSSNTGHREPRTLTFTVPSLPRTRLGRPTSYNRSWLSAGIAVLFVVAISLAGFSGAWLENRHDENSNGVTVGNLSSQK